jgi:hypothetical protein
MLNPVVRKEIAKLQKVNDKDFARRSGTSKRDVVLRRAILCYIPETGSLNIVSMLYDRLQAVGKSCGQKKSINQKLSMENQLWFCGVT